MNIAVYLGSSFGQDPIFRESIRELGEWIAEHGHTLIYGGSKIGLMGVLAESAAEHGGSVIGVEPQFFVDQVMQYEKLTKLIVTQTMPERKTEMIRLSDAFIAFPGGVGTLEEISEVISLLRLDMLQAEDGREKTVMLYDLNGFYEPLRRLIRSMTENGFLEERIEQKIKWPSDLTEIAAILESVR